MKVLALLFVHLAPLASAQIFSPAPQPVPVLGAPGPRPAHGSVVHLDVARLKAQLEGAPQWDESRLLHEYGLAIDLPHPDGSLTPCSAAASPVMEAALAARYPEITTYVVQTADGLAGGRIELSPRGLTGMVRQNAQGRSRSWIIDPWQSRDPEHVVAYWLSDLPRGEWTCHVPGGDEVVADVEPSAYEDRNVVNLRRYRMAMACTGEYGLYQCTVQGNPPNPIDPLAALVTAVSRANVVYEQDLAVHFDLVANNDLLVFTDPATDPYPSTCGGVGGTDCSGPILGVNQGVIDGIIGASNYEVGHVMTRVVGGVAYLSSVCGSNKAGGVSGIARGGDVEIYSANVLIHELGHQFGGNHTFSGTRGRCGNNANLNTAWEAGSGSSPLAYAGACPVGGAPPSDNVVQFADPFFHHGSVNEMRNFLASPSNNCPVAVLTSNNVPVITSVSANRTIPALTPFILEATATDEDSSDVLTYSWEQFNNGVRRPLSGDGSADNGAGALFRIFPPATRPWRTFPQMADILSGVATPGEQLPSFAGAVRRFRVIVRDNRAGAGASVFSENVNLTIAGNTTPFAVTAPAAGQLFVGGRQAGVTWSVSGTDQPPVSCSTVQIQLSVDGGQNFAIVANVPNSGSATITLPSTATSDARIMVRAVGNHFFNISRRFEIFIPCAADFNMDGGVDADDVIAFFSAWDAGLPAADFDGDLGVDGDDVIAFFRAWDARC